MSKCWKINFIEFLFYTPPTGPLKTCTQKIFFLKITFSLSKVVYRPGCQNILSTIKIRLAYKIWVLYLQNQASYVHFSFVKAMRNLNLKFFWNPEFLLKYWDFWLIFGIIWFQDSSSSLRWPWFSSAPNCLLLLYI